MSNKKRILMAIPTAKNICVETFKSMWDLWVPDDVELDFTYSFGYTISQVRNLIAHRAEPYDYLFSVDSDIVLPQDCLVKMLAHDVDLVSGVYIQRRPDAFIPEIYEEHPNGSILNVGMHDLNGPELKEIAGCGFGCVLVKSELIRKMGYPHFVYKEALDHHNTVSEDVYFCMKAKSVGARLWVDPTIRCQHIGQAIFFPPTR